MLNHLVSLYKVCYRKENISKKRMQPSRFLFLKALLCTNVLNDIPAAPFLVVFLLLAAEKDTEKGAAVTSLRTFVRSNAFNSCVISTVQ